MVSLRALLILLAVTGCTPLHHAYLLANSEIKNPAPIVAIERDKLVLSLVKQEPVLPNTQEVQASDSVQNRLIGPVMTQEIFVARDPLDGVLYGHAVQFEEDTQDMASPGFNFTAQSNGLGQNEAFLPGTPWHQTQMMEATPLSRIDNLIWQGRADAFCICTPTPDILSGAGLTHHTGTAQFLLNLAEQRIEISSQLENSVRIHIEAALSASTPLPHGRAVAIATIGQTPSSLATGQTEAAGLDGQLIWMGAGASYKEMASQFITDYYDPAAPDRFLALQFLGQLLP